MARTFAIECWLLLPFRLLNHDYSELGRKNWHRNQTTITSLLETLMSAREKLQDLRDLAQTLDNEEGALNVTYEVLRLMPAIWANTGN